jgi:1-acyl-sn-glycerol-3-phosphate acyltransferase
MRLLRTLLTIPYYAITYVVVILMLVPLFHIVMRILNRTEVYNKDVVQRAKPPFLFCSNHVSMLDDAFVGPQVFLPRSLWDLRFIPYHAPEKKNFFKGPFFSMMMHAARAIPFTRGKGVHQPGMERMIRALKKGNTVHIYPEGTRTRTGQIGKAKIGVGRLVRETGSFVIPCYHRGLEKVLPIGHKIPRAGHRVQILVGAPLHFDDFMQMPNAPKTWRIIANRIIEAIQELRAKLEAGQVDRGLSPELVKKPESNTGVDAADPELPGNGEKPNQQAS